MLANYLSDLLKLKYNVTIFTGALSNEFATGSEGIVMPMVDKVNFYQSQQFSIYVSTPSVNIISLIKISGRNHRKVGLLDGHGPVGPWAWLHRLAP